MANKSIFVVCPIGGEGSPERAQSDQLLKHVIEPVAQELEFDVIRSDKIEEPGRITFQIIKELGNADIVIADLTGKNANVMYEIGLRQGFSRPYVLMAKKGEALPFDLFDNRTIFYELNLDGVEPAKASLHSHITSASKGNEPTPFLGPFSGSDKNDGAQDEQSVLLSLLEMNGRLLREMDELKQSILPVSGYVTSLYNSKQQEMAMGMMSNMFSQALQNPDGLKQLMALSQPAQTAPTPRETQSTRPPGARPPQKRR